MRLLELYQKAPYEPLVPSKSNPKQDVFKFNSPQHFISWVKHLDENFKRGSSYDSSETGDYNFCLSRNLEDAYEVIRETRFSPSDNIILDRRISEIKKRSYFSDDGYEIAVPEYIAMSDRVWLTTENRETPTRIINDTLFIDAGYNSSKDAEICKKIGVKILEYVYRRRVIPRKMTIFFAPEGLRNETKKESLLTVDVSFTDLNGIAKMLHPSAFRRLWFRVAEQYSDLSYGYGRTPNNQTTSKHTITISTLYELNDEEFENEIDKFLGLTK